jgi:alpha-glucosidase
MDPHRPKAWYRNEVLYHIYPLSFADTNGDGFGDLNGIIQHLDYLNSGGDDSLGVGAVWLSPIFITGFADWGYDVIDHKAVDPRFGTMSDFERLLKKAHDRGMKVLLDYVPNHTSDKHAWFRESRASKDSAKRDWYIWADPAEAGGPPNNWLSRFGGPAWTLDDATGQYYMHTFLPEQPDLNWRNQQVRREMLSILSFWLDKGVDGFRADAVYGLLKDEQLRDDLPNPNFVAGVSDPADRLLRVHSASQHGLNEVIGSFCEVLAHDPGSYLLSEAYLNIPALHQLYQACRKHPVHAPFNFNLMSLEWGAQSFRGFIDEYEKSLGPEDWPNYVLGNHDRHRLASRLGTERARLMGLMQLTLRGLPVIYYGDELGLPDSVIRRNQVRDPWELRVPSLGLGRDAARTPMPWQDGLKVGFTTGHPWLPVGSAAQRMNVQSESREPQSSLSMYRHLIHLRKHSPALVEGDYRSVDLGNDKVFAYIRETESQRLLILLNFDKQPARVEVSGPVGAWVAGTHKVDGDGEWPSGSTFRLDGYEGRVYELRQGAINGTRV